MNNSGDTDQLTFWSEEPHASHSVSPDSARDWPTPAETWPSSIWDWLTAYAPAGWCGRMSPVSCHRTEDGTLEPSSGRWQNSGTGSHGECWTLRSCERAHTHGLSANLDAACSVSDILETGGHLLRFCLSRRAADGIIRRISEKKTRSGVGGTGIN